MKEHMKVGSQTFRELGGVYRRLDPTALSCMRYPRAKGSKGNTEHLNTKYSRFIRGQISKKTKLSIH